MAFKPALNITDQIADHLGEQIIQGALPGGTRIQELKIAKRLSVSRGSIREALLILERRHLIEIVPRKGALVNRITKAEAADVIDLIAQLQVRWIKRLALRSRGEDGALCSAIAAMDASARQQDLGGLLAGRDAFYNTLLKDANPYLVGVFECLLPPSQKVLRILIQDHNVDLHDISRYYRALQHAFSGCDEARIDELVTAFARRLKQLSEHGFDDVEVQGLSVPQAVFES